MRDAFISPVKCDSAISEGRNLSLDNPGTSKNLPQLSPLAGANTSVWEVVMNQGGVFGFSEHLNLLSANGDPLEDTGRFVDF